MVALLATWKVLHASRLLGPSLKQAEAPTSYTEATTSRESTGSVTAADLVQSMKVWFSDASESNQHCRPQRPKSSVPSGCPAYVIRGYAVPHNPPAQSTIGMK